MGYDYSDRRKHQRINVEKAIYIEVVGRGSRSEADNTIIRCETVDISVAGLKIWVQNAIPQGSKLNIAAPMDDWKENLELVGKVMWLREADNAQGYWVGLELEDTGRDNMERWFRVVHFLNKSPDTSG
jgi:hypothetical protein